MSAREELALVLANAQRVRNGSSTLPSADQCSRLAFDDADAILAAGYSKPRTITTVEELDALPENTVIRDAEPATMQLMDGRWWSVGSGNPWDADMIDLPATVLYTPKES